VRRRGRRGRTPNCRREPAWPSPARPSCRAWAVLPCKGLVERWWPMGRYSFQSGGDPRGSGNSGYSQPNRRCHWPRIPLRPKDRGAHRAVAAPSPPVLSRRVHPLSLTPSNQSTVFPLIPPSEPLETITNWRSGHWPPPM
jgi:hypothetical protein